MIEVVKITYRGSNRGTCLASNVKLVWLVDHLRSNIGLGWTRNDGLEIINIRLIEVFGISIGLSRDFRRLESNHYGISFLKRSEAIV